MSVCPGSCLCGNHFSCSFFSLVWALFFCTFCIWPIVLPQSLSEIDGLPSHFDFSFIEEILGAMSEVSGVFFLRDRLVNNTFGSYAVMIVLLARTGISRLFFFEDLSDMRG